MTFFVLTFLFGSALQTGWVLSECGQVGLVLDQKLGWNATAEDAGFFNYLTIATVLPSPAVGIGGYFGGTLLPKYGSRKLIIATNIIALIFNLLKLIEATATIMVARFVVGLVMGIAVVCLSKAINDTVPAEHASLYGAFVNAGFGIGLFFSNLMGLLIPIDNGEEGDVQRMKDDQNWRLVFAVPILLELYTIIILLFYIKYESIIQLVQDNEPNSDLLKT